MTDKWIPVSERLPEDEGVYLAKWIPITEDQSYKLYLKMVCDDGLVNEYSNDRAAFLSNAYVDGFVESLYFNQKERCFVANLDNGEEYNVNRFIEYWMPLPEPYEPEGGGKHEVARKSDF